MQNENKTEKSHLSSDSSQLDTSSDNLSDSNENKQVKQKKNR